MSRKKRQGGASISVEDDVIAATPRTASISRTSTTLRAQSVGPETKAAVALDDERAPSAAVALDDLEPVATDRTIHDPTFRRAPPTRWRTFRNADEIRAWASARTTSAELMLLDGALATTTSDEIRTVLLAMQRWAEAEQSKGSGGSELARVLRQDAASQRWRRLQQLATVPDAVRGLQELDASERIEKSRTELVDQAWLAVKNDAQLDGFEHGGLVRAAASLGLPSSEVASAVEQCRVLLASEPTPRILQIEPPIDLEAASRQRLPPLETNGRFATSPESIADLHRCIRDDAAKGFRNTLQVFEREMVSTWLAQHLRILPEESRERRIIERHRSAARQAESQSSRGASAVWAFLWTTGYRGLHLPNGAIVESLDHMAAIRPRPNDLVEPLRSGHLAMWCEIVLENRALARVAMPAKDTALEATARAFLWATIDDELVLGGVALRSPAQLVAFASSLAKFEVLVAALSASDIEAWWSGLAFRGRAPSAPSAVLRQARDHQADARAAAYAIFFSVGERRLPLFSDQRVLHIESITELEGAALVAPAAVAEAVRVGGFQAWVRARADLPRVAPPETLTAWLQAEQPSHVRLAQRALRYLGCARLPVGSRVLANRNDLLEAYESDAAGLATVAADLTLVDWAELQFTRDGRSTESLQRTRAMIAAGRVRLAVASLAWAMGGRSLRLPSRCLHSIEGLRAECDESPDHVVSAIHEGLVAAYLQALGRNDLATHQAAVEGKRSELEEPLLASQLAELLGAPRSVPTPSAASVDFALMQPGSSASTRVQICHPGLRGMMGIRLRTSDSHHLALSLRDVGTSAYYHVEPGRHVDVDVVATMSNSATAGTHVSHLIVTSANGDELQIPVSARRAVPFLRIVVEVAVHIALLAAAFAVFRTSLSFLADSDLVVSGSLVLDPLRSYWSAGLLVPLVLAAIAILLVAAFPWLSERKPSTKALMRVALVALLAWPWLGEALLGATRAVDAIGLASISLGSFSQTSDAILRGDVLQHWAKMGALLGLVVGPQQALTRSFSPLIGGLYALIVLSFELVSIQAMAQ